MNTHDVIEEEESVCYEYRCYTLSFFENSSGWRTSVEWEIYEVNW